MKGKLVLVIVPIALVGATLIGCMGSGGGLGGGGGVTVNVSMDAMTFTPVSVNAHAGDTVKWTNNSAAGHTATSDTGQPGLASGTVNPAGTFSWTVPAGAAIGTHFFYHCIFHGAAGNGTTLGTGMAGEITVN